MTKQEIINYMYENHVQGDFKIEEMAEDLAQPELIRCKDCKSWGRLVTYKDGSTMIDCKRGRSIDPEGYCHLAELRGDADVPESIT